MMFVCLSVSCLSARISQEPHIQTSRNFPHVLTVAVARFSSDDTVIRYVLPGLCMTSRFSIIGHSEATPTVRVLKATHQGAGSTDSIPPIIRRVLGDSPGGRTGGEV